MAPRKKGGQPPNPSKPEDAIAWFRAKLPIRKSDWERLSDQARKRAFTAAGVARLDVLAAVQKRLESAIAKGTTLQQFKKEVRAKLESEWGGPIPGRIENIFRTNSQAAYTHGRFNVMVQPDNLKARPYWKYVSVMDARTSEHCKPLNGIILPADHPWWKTHIPPLHFQCRSVIVPLSTPTAERQGVSKRAPKVEPLEGFGSAPGKAQWQPDLTKYPPELVKIYRRGR